MTRPLTSKIIFCFLFIFLTFSIFAQTIENIEVRGSSDFAESDYSKWINLNNKKYFDSVTDTIKQRIAFNLQHNGYYNFQIDSIKSFFSDDSQRVNISINLNEGNPTYVNEIFIKNLDSLELERVNEKFYLLKDSPFIVSEFENSFSEMLTYFENNGFPFTSINIESLFFFNDTEADQYLVDIYLNFSKNQISKIDTIIINGNSKTKDYVITRELRINKGDVYSQDKIDKMPSKLNRLHFFETISTPKYFFNSEDKGILQIDVVEKGTNFFDGIIGYIPPNNDNKKGYLTGLVNVNLRNLFGTGRAVSFKWSKLDQYSQELELKYLEPWVFGFPFNIDLLLFQRQQDSSYVQRTLNGKIEFLATESFSSALIFSEEFTIPTNPDESGFTVFNSTTINSGVNFKYDTRDDIFVPTKGLYVLNTFKYSSKTINGPEQYVSDTTNTNPNQFRIELDLLLFKSFYTRHIPFIGLHLRELRGDDIEISDMFRVGGNNTLRGYEENQFTANRFLWANIEYRYLIGRRSYAFLFTDIAYYKRNSLPLQQLPELSATKIGYGIGITFETALGMLAVSYAIAQGDNFNQGKIHFGLIGEF
ncbi:MAG: BamA/TamA family outer membrane protein [Melioribacteraceae bacterium]|nr:BamA/TamA family outer membrane protein [Melioribacteraceae bacterium]